MEQESSSNSHEEQIAILRAVLDTAVDAILTIDDRGIIRHANRAVTEMFCYSEQELIGNNVSMLMPSPEREEHDGYIQNYLTSGIPRIIGAGREVMARRKDGSLLQADLAVSEVRVNEKRLFTGIIRDMTSRKAAEALARRERNFSNYLVDTANVGVVVLDVHGKVARINPFMENLSGYQLEDVRGKDWFETFLSKDIQEEHRGLFQEVLSGQAIQGHINEIVTQKGEVRTITWAACVLHDADDVREGVLAVGSDITELKQAELKLIERERLAAIGQMVTGLAHESRNALQRARASLDVLELDVEESSHHLISQTQAALVELQRLYEEVRNYATPILLDRSSCSIIKLCHQTWAHLTDLHEETKVVLKLVDELKTQEFELDSSRLQQVFRNIMENSIAACSGHGELKVTCRERGHYGNQSVQILFEDNGSGMTEKQLKNVFDPFFTTKTKGTGLGMAIAKRLVDAHNGTISAMNRPEGGVRITVELPFYA